MIFTKPLDPADKDSTVIERHTSDPAEAATLRATGWEQQPEHDAPDDVSEGTTVTASPTRPSKPAKPAKPATGDRA